MSFVCTRCGATVYPQGGSAVCPSCGQTYTTKVSLGWDFGSILLGMAVGAVIVGPFVWTAVGREVATRTIAKGAAVTKERVQEWLKRGEASEGGVMG